VLDRAGLARPGPRAQHRLSTGALRRGVRHRRRPPPGNVPQTFSPLLRPAP